MQNIFSLQNFRQRLARTDSLFTLSILGAVSGLGTGLVIVAFRMSFELPQKAFLPHQNPENYELLSSRWQFFLPLLGAFLLALVFRFLAEDERQVGVAHVIHRLTLNHSKLPFKNFLVQFFSGSLSITSGHSAGREGAAVHLGAAISSLLGQRYALPHNSLRTLAACGAAAAISASFNTPVAGVIFAVEVILLEYTLGAITPLIVASVVGALITRVFYGNEPAFNVPELAMNDLIEIPYLVLTGAVVGALATAFNKSACFFAHRSQDWSVITRFSLAGIITAIGAVITPQIMGIGYDTVNQALLGTLPIALLLMITLTKLFVTSAAVGLGLPTGLIGPSLFIGATVGGAIGIVGLSLVPDQTTSSGYYAMLGMGAMMGAILRAPLAALTALMELTANTHIILPGMLVIIVANLVCNGFFRSKSIFNQLLEVQGVQLSASALDQVLERAGVYAIIDRKITRLPKLFSANEWRDLENTDTLSHPGWLVVEEENQPLGICPNEHLSALGKDLLTQDMDTINLFDALPLKQIKAISPQASLREALNVMNQEHVSFLFVSPGIESPYNEIFGIVSRQALVDYYSKQQQF